MTLFCKNSRFTKQSTLKSGHKGPKLKIYYKNHILRAFFIFLRKKFCLSILWLYLVKTADFTTQGHKNWQTKKFSSEMKNANNMWFL